MENENLTPEEAYEKAREVIAEVKAKGAPGLNFSRFDFGPELKCSLPTLEEVPPELGELVDLDLIDLSYTHIGDASLKALAGLKELTLIGLIETRVSNAGLSYLVDLPKLRTLGLGSTDIGDHGLLSIAKIESLEWLNLQGTQITEQGLRTLALTPGFLQSEHGWGILHIHDTPAYRVPGIQKIYDAHPDGEATEALFTYLRETAAPPADSPLGGSYHVPENGPITSDPVHAEAVGAEMEELRQDLLSKAADLIAALDGSNQHAGLATAAGHYRRRMDHPVPQIPLNLLFSSANTLRAALEAHEAATREGEVNNTLPTNAAAALTDLIATHGLFWMSMPKGAEIEARVIIYLDGQRNPVATRAAEQIVGATEGKDAVLTPADQETLSDDLMAAQVKGRSAELAEKTLFGRIRNAISSVARKVWKAGGAKAKKVVSKAVGKWILENEDKIRDFLKATLGGEQIWFDVLIEALKALL